MKKFCQFPFAVIIFVCGTIGIFFIWCFEKIMNFFYEAFEMAVNWGENWKEK
jgi:hypothetical protein